jgi:hypothetical protein
MQFLNERHSVLGGQRRFDRRLAMRAAFLVAVLCLTGCQSSGPQDITVSIGGASEPES